MKQRKQPKPIIGNIIYVISENEVYDMEVYGIYIDSNNTFRYSTKEWLCSDNKKVVFEKDFGKTAFLSYEEAENALLKGVQNDEKNSDAV